MANSSFLWAAAADTNSSGRGTAAEKEKGGQDGGATVATLAPSGEMLQHSLSRLIRCVKCMAIEKSKYIHYMKRKNLGNLTFSRIVET